MDRVLENILQNFPIDVKSTQFVEVEGLKKDTKLFKINPYKSGLSTKDVNPGDSFIIDSFSGMKIACHPHIVGKAIDTLSLDCAKEFVKCIKKMRVINEEDSVILHILRGALGYKLVEAFNRDIPVISVHPKYYVGGYRSHAEDSDNVSIVFRDYDKIKDLREISTLIIPDTYATGKSAETAIRDIVKTGIKIKNVILYGFISKPSLIKIAYLTSKNGIKLTSFAIGSLTQLSYNNYDMPLYGLDESLLRDTNKINPLGCIIDLQTLKRYLPKYVAGLDQPGDWSERQNSLYTGYSCEKGNIHGHLKKSISFINSLIKINSKQAWFNDFHENIAKKELYELNKTLESYSYRN